MADGCDIAIDRGSRRAVEAGLDDATGTLAMIK